MKKKKKNFPNQRSVKCTKSYNFEETLNPCEITWESKLLRTMSTYFCIQLSAKDKINSMVMKNNTVAVNWPLDKQQKYRIQTWLVFFMKINILVPQLKISFYFLRWWGQIKTKLSTPHYVEGDICKCRFPSSIVWITLIIHICSCLKGLFICILFLGAEKWNWLFI